MSSPAYGVFVSQLIWYIRTCSKYEGFIITGRRLTNKLLIQIYVIQHLKSSPTWRKYASRVSKYLRTNSFQSNQRRSWLLLSVRLFYKGQMRQWPNHITIRTCIFHNYKCMYCNYIETITWFLKQFFIKLLRLLLHENRKTSLSPYNLSQIEIIITLPCPFGQWCCLNNGLAPLWCLFVDKLILLSI